MSDDLVTRLRGGDEHLPPATCWHCVEWGCENADGKSVPCDCDDPCDCDNNCDCECHPWRDIVGKAADEIERLRKIIHDFYFEEEKYQDAMNSDSVEQYIIPQSWKDAYIAFQNEARKIEFGDD